MNSAFGTLDVIRDSEQGPIVLAHMSAWYRTDGATPLAAALGTTVTLDPYCAWTADLQLWAAVFGTTPQVRVSSGTIGDLTVDGRPYHAYVTSAYSNSVWITIYPGN